MHKGKLLLALAPVLLLVAASEVWFRLNPHADAYETRGGLVDPDPDLIWRLKPVASGPLATNELGLRDTAYRADADVKILLLGDSVSWGNGIADLRQVYPHRLEKRLATRSGRTHEIINASVPGYSTFQQLRYLETDGLALEPHAIILQFCLNDVVERYRSLAQYGGNNHFLGVDTRAAVRGLYGTLLRTSRAFEAAARFAQHRARDYEQYYSRKLAQDDLSSDLESAWSRTLDEIEAIRRIATREGLPMLLVIAPFRFQLADPSGLRQPQDRLIAYAREAELAYVDVLAALAELPGRDALAAFNDGSHFSSRGHDFVADALVAPVERLLGGAAR